jgi:hypothetical protein
MIFFLIGNCLETERLQKIGEQGSNILETFGLK